MKSKFTLAMLLVVTVALVHGAWSHAEPLPETATTAPVPEFVTLIDDRGNGISGTIDEADIAALAAAGFKQIIRLNGDSQSDRGHLSIGEEADLADQYGLRLYYFNIEGNIIAAGNQISYLMRNGRTLLHCKHGAHRAPAMAAHYLQKEIGVSSSEAVERVGWQDLVKKPGRYARYTEAVLR
jgi:protein tyrosine phosphatase (PTP) superfamily phosphohydrolase (DUF442 family)